MKEKRNFTLIYTLIDCLEKVRKKTYNSRNYVVVTVRVLVIILSYESTFYCNGILAFLPEHGQCLVSYFYFVILSTIQLQNPIRHIFKLMVGPYIYIYIYIYIN